MKTEYRFQSSDGQSSIYYAVWQPAGEVRFTLQLIHGMIEFVDRYAGFAEFICSIGGAVIGHDQIGHGHSADPSGYGYFGKKDGWIRLVDDVEILQGIIAERYPDVPHFILGHSMGSFVLRTFLARTHGEGLTGAIVEGTSGTNPAVDAGISLCRVLKAVKGPRSRCKLITMLAFGHYNKRIDDPKTGKEWLTRDTAAILDYLDDPMCDFEFSVSAYEDMLRLLKYASSDECYRNFGKELPVLLLSGAEDPVGEYGAGPREVFVKMQAAGCADTQLYLYDGMRHEPHNEIGKEKVFEDIQGFITGCMQKNGQYRQ